MGERVVEDLRVIFSGRVLKPPRAGARRRWEYACKYERFLLAICDRTPVETLLAASDPPVA